MCMGGRGEREKEKGGEKNIRTQYFCGNGEIDGVCSGR